MRTSQIYWMLLALLAAPLLTAQHLQFAATFGGVCTSSSCYGSDPAFAYWSPDTVKAIAVDALGNTYAAGVSYGAFPLVNAIEPSPYASANASNGWAFPFVAKIDPTGMKLLYATPIGGLAGSANGVAVDSAGNAYVTGSSQAAGFPGISGTPTGNVFLIKLDPNGRLLLSVLFGGTSGNEAGNSIALDQTNDVYITGVTASPDFPITAGAYSPSFSGPQDVFLTKMSGATGQILYSTFIGPGKNPQLALGAPGDVFLAAETGSTAWPTTPGVVQPQCAGTNCSNLILLRLNFSSSLGQPATPGLVYATYLGGSGAENLGGIANDSVGSLYISGTTTSSNFPVVGPGVVPNICAEANPVNCGAKAFVAHLNPSATALEYSTYLGGNGADIGRGIAIDSSGNAYVTGQTTSGNFPAVHPIQAAIIQGVCFDVTNDFYAFCGGAGFLTVLNPQANAILRSTFLGEYPIYVYGDQNIGFIGGEAVAVDAAGNAYVAGSDLALDGTPLNPAVTTPLGTANGEATVLKIAPTGQPVTFAANGIVNSASYAPGLPFAGGLATVFLDGLTGINGIIAADRYPLPTQLAGVSVKVNGELAPLLAVASLPGGGQQINFQVPLDRGLAPIVNDVANEYPAVEIDAAGGATFTGVLPVAPGIFSFPDGTPVVEHTLNAALVSKANPVLPGETLTIYVTGLGAYTPGQSGVPAAGTESLVSLLPTVSLGNAKCTVLSAGPAPGYAGLDQIRCQTSKQTPKGLQPLQVVNLLSPFAAPPPAFVANSNIVSLPVE